MTFFHSVHDTKEGISDSKEIQPGCKASIKIQILHLYACGNMLFLSPLLSYATSELPHRDQIIRAGYGRSRNQESGSPKSLFFKRFYDQH
jgi:hypothetical protein